MVHPAKGTSARGSQPQQCIFSQFDGNSGFLHEVMKSRSVSTLSMATDGSRCQGGLVANVKSINDLSTLAFQMAFLG
jgi:hypothetical protein